MTDKERARKYALERQRNLHLSQRDTNLIRLAYLHGLKKGKSKRHKTRVRKFNLDKVLTCTTADKVRIGTKGCFADNLAALREEFALKKVHTLTHIFSEESCTRFESDHHLGWLLFYPIDDVEEEMTGRIHQNVNEFLPE